MSDNSPKSFQLQSRPVVGIIGGIGAGKSSVTRAVSDLRLYVIDADAIGHQVLNTDNVSKQLAGLLGTQILDDAGQIDRGRIAERVFGNTPEHTMARKQLEGVVHPAIRAEMMQQIKAAPDDADAIILDAAVMLEAGWADACDVLVFIDTPLELRQRRVQASRGWSPEELARREQSQWPLEEKRKFADFTVSNSGDPQSAAQQLSRFIRGLKP
ncbi:MAG: dephospho-CoA kinase [Planctomycetaceae bacterium]|nr:dephospho-CoA kinase [Planctomycetaceae bacterium]